MPALAAVPGVARVVCRGTANGQPIVNVFHINNGPGSGIAYDAAGISALASNVATFYKNRFFPLFNNLYSGDDVVATDLSSATGAVGAAVLTGGGAVASPSFPQSVACCVTWKIGRHYRGGHPRTYLGPLGATASDSPVSLAAAFVTSAATAANGFMNDVAALVIATRAQKLVCVHRQVDGVVLTTPLVDTITAVFVDSRIDSMRRRLGPDR